MQGKNFKIKKCSKKYIYILITITFFIIKNLVLSLSELSFNTNNNIFGIDLVMRNHILIKLLIEYFGYIIFGTIFSTCLNKNKYMNKKNAQYIFQKNATFFSENNKPRITTIKVLLISCLLFGIQLIVRSFLYFFNTWKLDMWIFNIFFIYIFMKYIMNNPIYKHQLITLIFIFIINIILIIISSSIEYNGSSFYNLIINIYGSGFYIFLFYIIYLALSALICSSQVFQKKLMDIYYVSPYTILFVIGLITSLLTLIALIITTNVNCGEYLSERNICPIFYKGYQYDHVFLDNFIIYLYNLSDRYNIDKTSFYLEIFLVYPLYSFLNFMKYLYETFIILHLDPNYVVLSDIVYYSIKIVIYLIHNPKDITSYLTLIGEFVALFGYFFYLEIFEIKICGLNRDTKNRISLRGMLETIDNNKIISDDDEEDEDEIADYSFHYKDYKKENEEKENENVQKIMELSNINE